MKKREERKRKKTVGLGDWLSTVDCLSFEMHSFLLLKNIEYKILRHLKVS